VGQNVVLQVYSADHHIYNLASRICLEVVWNQWNGSESIELVW